MVSLNAFFSILYMRLFYHFCCFSFSHISSSPSQFSPRYYSPPSHPLHSSNSYSSTQIALLHDSPLDFLLLLLLYFLTAFPLLCLIFYPHLSLCLISLPSSSNSRSLSSCLYLPLFSMCSLFLTPYLSL